MSKKLVHACTGVSIQTIEFIVSLLHIMEWCPFCGAKTLNEKVTSYRQIKHKEIYVLIIGNNLHVFSWKKIFRDISIQFSPKFRAAYIHTFLMNLIRNMCLVFALFVSQGPMG